MALCKQPGRYTALSASVCQDWPSVKGLEPLKEDIQPIPVPEHSRITLKSEHIPAANRLRWHMICHSYRPCGFNFAAVWAELHLHRMHGNLAGSSSVKGGLLCGIHLAKLTWSCEQVLLKSILLLKSEDLHRSESCLDDPHVNPGHVLHSGGS